MQYSVQVPDRRQYQRITTGFPAFLEGQPNREEVVTDLSMGGCTLKAETPLSEGSFLQLLSQTSDRQPPIRVDTAIVTSIRSRSVGLQFLEFPPGEQDRLSQFVYSYLVSYRTAPAVTKVPAVRSGLRSMVPVAGSDRGPDLRGVTPQALS